MKKPCRQWGRFYAGRSAGPGEFATVAGMAVSDYYVYICDFVWDRVQIFRHDGSWLNMVNGKFQYPVQVGVLSHSRQILVRESLRNTLQCFSFVGVWERNIYLPFHPRRFALSLNEIFVQDDGQSVHVFDFEGEWLRRFALHGDLIASAVADFIWISRPKNEYEKNEIAALGLDGCEIAQFAYPDVSCIVVGPDKSLLLSQKGHILSPHNSQRDYFHTRRAIIN